MKIRFYCDVPEYKIQGWNLTACEAPYGANPVSGQKRIAFDVDFPDDVLREADGVAVTKYIGEVPAMCEEQNNE